MSLSLQLYRLSLSPNPLPLERYICNFLQEVPCPVPGKIEVQYSMVDQVRGLHLASHLHNKQDEKPE